MIIESFKCGKLCYLWRMIPLRIRNNYFDGTKWHRTWPGVKPGARVHIKFFLFQYFLQFFKFSVIQFCTYAFFFFSFLCFFAYYYYYYYFFFTFFLLVPPWEKPLKVTRPVFLGGTILLWSSLVSPPLLLS